MSITYNHNLVLCHSELYWDLHPERGLEGADLDDDSRFIEFYNLVGGKSRSCAGHAFVHLYNLVGEKLRLMCASHMSVCSST